MRNYKQFNNYQTSKEYYINELINKNKNLNSSINELDFLEYHLEKVLDVSYRFFAPFFKDEEVFVEYKNEYANNSIDKEFDKKIDHLFPVWLQNAFILLSSIYYRFFPKEKIKMVLQKLKIYLTPTLFLRRIKSLKNRYKFFAFKSPP